MGRHQREYWGFETSVIIDIALSMDYEGLERNCFKIAEVFETVSFDGSIVALITFGSYVIEQIGRFSRNDFRENNCECVDVAFWGGQGVSAWSFSSKDLRCCPEEVRWIHGRRCSPDTIVKWRQPVIADLQDETFVDETALRCEPTVLSEQTAVKAKQRLYHVVYEGETEDPIQWDITILQDIL